MCGIFGIVGDTKISSRTLNALAEHARRRGRDSSGLVFNKSLNYDVFKADYDITRLLKKCQIKDSTVVCGHSRLVTNSTEDNQPVVRGRTIVLHNGIVVNDKALWESTGLEQKLRIDTEIIAAIAEEFIEDGGEISNLPGELLAKCNGFIACVLMFPWLGKGIVFSNNGSLYGGFDGNQFCFSSERWPLKQLDLTNIFQIREQGYEFDIPSCSDSPYINETKCRSSNLVPELCFREAEAKELEFKVHNIRRCNKCILPETMPFITFNDKGVCNYCVNYEPRNNPKPKAELEKLVQPYRRASGAECIVPFSGGRDSCYALHLIIQELNLRPITYTYDWGMVTDLGRRNISRMCAALGVENIVVADDITKKRRNIKLNLQAWLKSPHLGMMSLLTAGDKHFFRHVETIKKETEIDLNLWGVNPLEVTHFKTGFLGIAPDFDEKRVYSQGALKQLRYHAKRTGAMMDSPSYFNRSLWDTLSGEYYRSFTNKKDYFHIFDYWRWDEDQVDQTLLGQYGWEKAIDTNTTWRIGDGTAALYNYIYYTVAGFTEHDTFRSNQIREGQISRDVALRLVQDENRPRYENIRWYLDVLGMDFAEVIGVINKIPKLFSEKF